MSATRLATTTATARAGNRRRALLAARSGCAPQIARYALQQVQVRCAGAPALPEVLNLTSARRDRGAKQFPLWGLAALSYL
jgi:hypothetical protein